MKSWAGRYWNIIVLLRWNITLAVIVLLRNYSALQIQSFLIISLCVQFLILKYKPIEESLDNKMSIFNEIMVSVYLYFTISLTDFFGEMIYREEVGFCLLGTIFITVLVNVLKTALVVIKDCIRKRRLSQLEVLRNTLKTLNDTKMELKRIVFQGDH